MKDVDVLAWYENHAKKLLEKHAPERLQAIEADYLRLKRLREKPEDVTICFLGNSGVGKSTLLNALVAGAQSVLPAGGIGPLTAQATEVRYSEERRYRVTYHPDERLRKIAAALEGRVRADQRAQDRDITALQATASELQSKLTEDDRRELIDLQKEESGFDEQQDPVEDRLRDYIKQANNIVCGNQFADRPLGYIVDALRLAFGLEPRWGSEIVAEDRTRMQRVQMILRSPTQDRSHERREGADPIGFQQDMVDHAAGFLSPLIERIEVGWPSDLLKSGIVLVDLPGVGIAQDAYRDVTSSYIRDKARAVIVTVDRAGPTEATVDLLRTSGYWERLVGASDDPGSDPCAMLIAVTRVDDVTQSEWGNLVAALPQGATRPRKSDVFARLVSEFEDRMRAQITDQLVKIGGSENESVNTAREQARRSILESLEIHPVSAPEMKKVLREDDDDTPFLKNPEQTGVPKLQRSLVSLAETERGARAKAIQIVAERLAMALRNEIQRIESTWQQDGRAGTEVERLEAALRPTLDEKKGEYRNRAACFRQFLEETVPAQIEALVLEAQQVAESEVNRYLAQLRGAHWATLRAAVRRGGTFIRSENDSRNINLPDDIASYFQEPMAAVWGQRLLRNIRQRTGELSVDMVQMVQELCDWANENGGAAVNGRLLANQQERIALLAEQMKAVGREAADELRDAVKSELNKTIRGPIRAACESFVQEGNDIGRGVKDRIIKLFNALARNATVSAKEPAIRILRENADRVRKDIQSALSNSGDPIQDTANLIVGRHDQDPRLDPQIRDEVLRDVRDVISCFPWATTADGQPAD